MTLHKQQLDNMMRVGLAIGLAMLTMSASAQELRSFRWQEVKTVCDFGRQPGTDPVPFNNGTYWIPLDQFNAARRCDLVIVWQNVGPAFNTGEPGIVAELIRNGGQRLGAASRIGGSDILRSSIPLRELPFGSTPFQAGLRVQRNNGEVRTTDPPFQRFGRFGTTDTAPPRITSFRILERSTGRVLSDGSTTATDPMLQLNLATTGGQPTEIMISERVSRTGAFSGATWRPYAPNTGQYGGVQMYTLQGRASGRKIVHVKVRSGSEESNAVSASVNYVNLNSHTADQLAVLEFAERNGFQHSVVDQSRKSLGPFGTEGPSTTCRVTDGGFDVIGPVGAFCTFRIFEGRSLNDGWTVEEIRPLASTSEFRVRMIRAANRGSRSPLTSFRIERLKAVNPRNISEQPGLLVRLRGPAEQDWRDAFRRAPTATRTRR